MAASRWDRVPHTKKRQRRRAPSVATWRSATTWRHSEIHRLRCLEDQCPRPLVGPFDARPLDGGATIGALAVSPLDSRVLLAGADFGQAGAKSGIYSSTDSGATWKLVLTGSSGSRRRAGTLSTTEFGSGDCPGLRAALQEVMAPTLILLCVPPAAAQTLPVTGVNPSR